MPKGYHHMTQEIRSQIYALKATGIALRKIGSIVFWWDTMHRPSVVRLSAIQAAEAIAMPKEHQVKASLAPKKLTPELISIILKKAVESTTSDY